MKPLHHFRLLYGVIFVLTGCLLLVGMAYRIKAREVHKTRETMIAQLREQQVEIINLRSRLASEAQARQNAADRLAVWEGIHPHQAESLQKKGVKGIIAVRQSRNVTPEVGPFPHGRNK